MPEATRFGATDRAPDWVESASPEVTAAWEALRHAIDCDLPPMGLAAGDRPCADAEVLASAMAQSEYLLVARLEAAAESGSLPFGGAAGLLTARGWSLSMARRLDRCGALAAAHGSVAAAWSTGLITSEHIDPVGRAMERFTVDELAAAVVEIEPHWGSWSPAAIARFIEAADRLLHPQPDPAPDEADAYETRHLSFGVLGDSVVITGSLPRVEGELVIAAIDAFAERLRSAADHVPASQRRADALVELVNTAHASGALPTRDGLPVAVTVTLEHSLAGDPLWCTSRGHALTSAEMRWAACDAELTPLHVFTVGAGPSCQCRSVRPRSPSRQPHASQLWRRPCWVVAKCSTPDGPSARRRARSDAHSPSVTEDASSRAVVSQPRPQVHHLTDWAAGGASDLKNLTLLCLAHHRQVDLLMWQIEPSSIEGSDVADADAADAQRPPQPTGWPANRGVPFVIRRTPRSRWRN